MTQVLAGLVLCGVGYVVIRTLLAARRGRDTRQAAAGAFRTLAPGLFLGAVGLFAVAGFLAITTVVLILALLSFLTGDDNYDAAAVAVMIGGIVCLVAGVAGALRWGVARLRRTAAARPSSSRDHRG